MKTGRGTRAERIKKTKSGGGGGRVRGKRELFRKERSNGASSGRRDGGKNVRMNVGRKEMGRRRRDALTDERKNQFKERTSEWR